MTGWMWILVTVIGAGVLGAAIFWGQRSTDQLRRIPGAFRRREEAAKDLCEEVEEDRQRM